ncbi:Golgi apyrase [Dipsacomyces acuminosporus]|nr:Golgi apyrase [Dipsacomyces acuminosporus]
MDGFLDSSKHSLGFLDMGGASAQIAFEPAKKAAQIHKHDLAKVTLRNLNGQDFNHDIFVATFLGHGTNEARRRYVELLKPISGLPVVKDDPCLLNGLALPTLDNKLVLKGSGSFEECVRATEPLLNKTICPIEPCLFAGVHAPEIDFGTQQFVGVSEYWYASNDYLQLGGVWDIQNFEQKAAEFCKQPWSHITSKYNINNDPLVSSSMFVMDVLSRPLQAAGVNMRSHPSTPKLRALQIEDSDSAPKHSSSVTNLAEYRARNAGLAAAEDTAMSRSSSVNSLVLLNRRRGGGPD